jgi:hypothetical protein
VRVADPLVSAAVMEHEDGRAFAWFVSQHDAPVAVEPLVASGSLVSLDGEPVGALELGPFGVVVVELEDS